MAYNREIGKWEGYIYKITNTINGKIYIGQTITTIKNRWYGHTCHAILELRQTVLERAIRKYGKENFKIEEIEKIYKESKDELRKELNYKEKYYISLFESLVSQNGYNVSAGGGASQYMQKPTYAFDTNGDFLKRFDSRTDAANYYNINVGDLCKAISLGNLCHNVYFSDNNVFDYNKFPSTNKKVDVYDKEGKYLYSCNSYTEAADIIGCDASDAYNVCIGKKFSTKNHVIRFQGDSFEKRRNRKCKKVNLYKNGLFYKTIQSVSKAADFLGIRQGDMSNRLNSKYNKIKGFDVYYSFDTNQPDKTKVIPY